MNKSYLIVPAVLFVLFGFFYNGALHEMHDKEVAKQQKIDQDKAAEKARKDEIEKKATAEAEKRQQEREAEEQAKLAKKEKDYQDAIDTLHEETAKYSGESDKLAKEVAALELQISQGRTDKERLNSESLELSKQVELAKINRRTAELEIQRLMEMVAKKLSDSSIAAAPPPPPIKEK